jgi:hypothetical protein
MRRFFVIRPIEIAAIRAILLNSGSISDRAGLDRDGSFSLDDDESGVSVA